MTCSTGGSTDRGSCESGSFHAEPTEPVLGIPVEQTSSLISADLLEGGETILLMLRPHPLYIPLTSLGTLLVLGAVVASSWLMERYYSVHWLPEEVAMLCGVFAALRLGWRAMEWWSRVYLLTDRRVIRIMGVSRTQIFQASLREIRHTEVVTTLRERATGLGTLSFSTIGPRMPEAYWVMIEQPSRVREAVQEAIQRYGG